MVFTWSESKFFSEADDVDMIEPWFMFCTAQQGIYQSPREYWKFKCDSCDWDIELWILFNFENKSKFDHGCTI